MLLASMLRGRTVAVDVVVVSVRRTIAVRRTVTRGTSVIALRRPVAMAGRRPIMAIVIVLSIVVVRRSVIISVVIIRHGYDTNER